MGRMVAITAPKRRHGYPYSRVAVGGWQATKSAFGACRTHSSVFLQRVPSCSALFKSGGEKNGDDLLFGVGLGASKAAFTPNSA